VSSSLSSAVRLANRNASEVGPIVSLLSGAGIAIALAVAGAAGLFLVRRRAREVALLFARGERVRAFASRTGLELTLPTVIGATAGFGIAFGIAAALAPSGSFDGATIASAAARGSIAAACGLLLGVAVASAAFLGQFDVGSRRFRRLGWLLWELPLLAVAGWLLSDVVSGGGVAASGSGATHHPTLPVFAVPLLFVTAAAGLTMRLLRLALRRNLHAVTRLPVGLFLAIRRLAAASGGLVALVVISALAFGAYFYAQALATSLERSVTEKSYVAYGGDAQGLLGEATPIPRSFRYPATEVVYGNQTATMGGPNGANADMLAVDPDTLGSVIRWYPDWGPDPRPLLPGLRARAGGALPVIATGSVPRSLESIWVQGVRLPVRVVARVSVFPTMSPGIPLLVTDARALDEVAARLALRRDSLVGKPLGLMVNAKR